MTEKLRLSNYKIGNWQHCHLAYYKRYIQGLSLKTKSHALKLGDVVHQLLHLNYSKPGGLTGDDFARVDELYEQSYPNDPEAIPIAIEAAKLLAEYLKRYSSDPINIYGSEVHLEKDYGDFILYARIDALGSTTDERKWRVEHKTTLKTDQVYLKGLRDSLQGSIAHLLLSAAYDEPISGTIYNLLVKTQTPKFLREYTRVNEAQLALAMQTCEGVARDIKRGDFYPSSSCYTFTECDFRPLCNYPEGEEEIINSFYEQRTIISAEEQSLKEGVNV